MNFIAIAGVITLRAVYECYSSSPKSSVSFLDRYSLQQFFRDDPDRYFNKLTQVNLIARGYDSVNSLIHDAVQSADDFSVKEQQHLREKCKLADKFLQQFNGMPYFPSKKVASMKWTFAKCVGILYEKGLPHTRQNIIFLYKHLIYDPDIVGMLIHEKVHVFYRVFPKDMKLWLHKNGYTIYKTLQDYPLARHNPDIDNIVYKDKKNNPILVEFTSKNPKSFDDVVYSVSKSNCLNKRGEPIIKCVINEHPNETIAYTVSSFYRDS